MSPLGEDETRAGQAQDEQEVTVRLIPVAKEIGEGKSNALPDDFRDQGLYQKGVLEPPYNPKELLQIVQESSILPQCVAAMVQNVHGFGFTLTADASLKPGNDGKYDPKVEAEKERLDFFFSYGHHEDHFNKTRKKVGRNLEETGNGYLEILRDGKGDLSGWEHLDPTEMRMTSVDADLTAYKAKVIVGTEIKEITYFKRFRRFVQLANGRPVVYFKEFGDPRAISAEDGSVISEQQLASDRPPKLATEVLFFRLYASGTPYGIPRWVGTMPSIAGARAADEVNWSFFDQKAVPPYFVLVSGGALTDKSVQRITDAIHGAKGREKFHNAVILETAAPAPVAAALGPAAKPTSITVQPMTVQQDGLFQDYDANSRTKTRSSFRLPPLFAGESQDYSHATAQASEEVAESQVFAPEREDFDEVINRRLMPALGAQYWRFKSNNGKATDPTELVDLLVKLAGEGALTAGELRIEAERILGKELEELPKADWLNMPFKLFLQLAGGSGQAATGDGEPQDGSAAPKVVPEGNRPGKKQEIRKSLAGVETVGDLVRLLVEVRSELLRQEVEGE